MRRTAIPDDPYLGPTCPYCGDVLALDARECACRVQRKRRFAGRHRAYQPRRRVQLYPRPGAKG